MMEWWEQWSWWSKALLIAGAIILGGTNLFMTAAIILAIGALAYVNHTGWWDAWPWWGNLLFTLGMFSLAIAAIALDTLWHRPKAEKVSPSEEKKE
jgi:hypothetical protein